MPTEPDGEGPLPPPTAAAPTFAPNIAPSFARPAGLKPACHPRQQMMLHLQRRLRRSARSSPSPPKMQQAATPAARRQPHPCSGRGLCGRRLQSPCWASSAPASCSPAPCTSLPWRCCTRRCAWMGWKQMPLVVVRQAVGWPGVQSVSLPVCILTTSHRPPPRAVPGQRHAVPDWLARARQGALGAALRPAGCQGVCAGGRPPGPASRPGGARRRCGRGCWERWNASSCAPCTGLQAAMPGQRVLGTDDAHWLTQASPASLASLCPATQCTCVVA